LRAVPCNQNLYSVPMPCRIFFSPRRKRRPSGIRQGWASLSFEEYFACSVVVPGPMESIPLYAGPPSDAQPAARVNRQNPVGSGTVILAPSNPSSRIRTPIMVGAVPGTTGSLLREAGPCPASPAVSHPNCRPERSLRDLRGFSCRRQGPSRSSIKGVPISYHDFPRLAVVDSKKKDSQRAE